MQVTMEKKTKFKKNDYRKLKSELKRKSISKSEALLKLGRELKYSKSKTSRAFSRNFLLAIYENDNLMIVIRSVRGELDVFCVNSTKEKCIKAFFRINKIFQNIFEERIYSNYIELNENNINIREMINSPIISGLICFLITLPIMALAPHISFIIIGIIILILGVYWWFHEREGTY